MHPGLWVVQISQVWVLLGNFLSNHSPEKLQNAIVQANQQKKSQNYFTKYDRKPL